MITKITNLKIISLIFVLFGHCSAKSTFTMEAHSIALAVTVPIAVTVIVTMVTIVIIIAKRLRDAR